MKLKVFFALLLLSGFVFFRCNTQVDRESAFAFNKEQGNCVRLVAEKNIEYDTLLIVPSHFYPSDLQDVFSINYHFKVATDPQKILFYVANGDIVRTIYCRCDAFVFDNRIVNNGVVVLTSGNCYSLEDKMDYQYVSFPTQRHD